MVKPKQKHKNQDTSVHYEKFFLSVSCGRKKRDLRDCAEDNISCIKAGDTVQL